MINKIEISNFLAFRRDDKSIVESFNINFSDGVNIFIGENGTGKTSLLKMLFAACEYSKNNHHLNVSGSKKFKNYFVSNVENTGMLLNYDTGDGYSYFKVEANGKYFEYKTSLSEDFSGGFDGLDEWRTLDIKPIFIPSKEMLSHSKGLLAMHMKMEIPFDVTLIDILANAQLPVSREVSPLDKILLDKISDIIDGEVVYENDTFYAVKRGGMKLEFSLEAEGLRKFGLLWKLIRNGLLNDKTILFWDEPEANLNPTLIPVLVDFLIELHRNGVQMFIATHDYSFVRYFDLKKDNFAVLFHNLYKNKNGYIECDSSTGYIQLNNNAFEKADKALYDMIVNKALEAF